MKISIITVSYNSERTIEQTIQSVINQDYCQLEYIIIDGKSTDNTGNIIEKYIEYISCYVSERDEGIYDAFNKGIEKATGEIIGFINSDDILAPGTLNYISKNFNSNTDVMFGNIIYFDDKIEKYKILRKADPKLRKIQYEMTPSIFHPATFIKKNAYKKFGSYNKQIKLAADWELLLRFYTQGANFYYVNQTLAYFRGGGASSGRLNCNFRIEDFNEYKQILFQYSNNKLKNYFYYYKKVLFGYSVYILRKFGIAKKIKKIINKNKYVEI